MPSNRDAAGVRSMIRPRRKGPRSVIVTMTDFPLLLCVTRTLVPKGRVRCAVVKEWSTILLTLAVLVLCLVEYTDATPLCRNPVASRVVNQGIVQSVWTDPNCNVGKQSFALCRLGCKVFLGISAGSIDLRSSANTQRRFKRTDLPIRLFYHGLASPFSSATTAVDRVVPDLSLHDRVGAVG